MSTIFEAPSNPDKHRYDDKTTDHHEPAADRVGEFTPEIGAHKDAADALPSHEDLIARQPREELTEAEKAQGRIEAERAKRFLGYN